MSPWLAAFATANLLQVSQAYRLREFTMLGVIVYTAGPALFLAVYLTVFWLTGPHMWGLVLGAVLGGLAQLAGDRLRLARDRKRKAGEGQQ